MASVAGNYMKFKVPDISHSTPFCVKLTSSFTPPFRLSLHLASQLRC